MSPTAMSRAICLILISELETAGIFCADTADETAAIVRKQILIFDTAFIRRFPKNCLITKDALYLFAERRKFCRRSFLQTAGDHAERMIFRKGKGDRIKRTAQNVDSFEMAKTGSHNSGVIFDLKASRPSKL